MREYEKSVIHTCKVSSIAPPNLFPPCSHTSLASPTKKNKENTPTYPGDIFILGLFVHGNNGRIPVTWRECFDSSPCCLSGSQPQNDYEVCRVREEGRGGDDGLASP